MYRKIQESACKNDWGVMMKLLSSRLLVGMMMSTLVLPVLAYQDGDQVVVECSGTAFKRDTARPTNSSLQGIPLYPMAKIARDEFISIKPGGHLTLLRYSDGAKVTITVPAKEPEYVRRATALQDTKDQHIHSEVSADFKEVHTLTSQYLTRVKGSLGHERGCYQIITDQIRPEIVLDFLPPKGGRSRKPEMYWIRTTMENGYRHGSRQWARCKVNLAAWDAGKRTKVTIPSLSLRPGQTVELCRPQANTPNDDAAWLRIARYDQTTQKQIESHIKTPDSAASAVEQINLFCTAGLYSRAVKGGEIYEKQFPAYRKWWEVKTNLLDARATGQYADYDSRLK